MVEDDDPIARSSGGSLVARLGGGPLWRQAQSMVIADWSHPGQPSYPRFIREFGLPGAEPTASGVVPPSLHGAISAHDHPKAA